MDEAIRDLVASSTTVDSAEAYREWERLCDERLAALRERCRSKRAKTSTGSVHSLIFQISRLEGVRNVLRDRFARVGAGVRGDRPGCSAWSEIETAFDGRVSTGAIGNLAHVEPRRFLEDARDEALARVRVSLGRHACLKVNAIFNGEFVAGAKVAVKSIATRNRLLLLASDLREWYDEHVIDTVLSDLEEFQERDSGWALSRILNLILNINKCNLMHAGCWVETPRHVRPKGAVVNVQSSDNACFAWAVVAALYPVDNHANRRSVYPHYSSKLNLDGIEFPMSLKQISRFERINDISVNVFTTRDKRDNNVKEILPLRLTDDKKDRHVNLLYIQSKTGDTGVGHFLWIKSLSRLLSSQMSRNMHAKHICDRCLHYFPSRERLSAHSVECARMNECAVVLPRDDERWLSFDNHDRKERLPFVGYADLECILEKVEETNDPSRRSHAYQHHRAFSVGYYLRCAHDATASIDRSHRGEDCVAWFADELNELAHRMSRLFSRNVPMPNLTPDEELNFSTATYCHICTEPFESDESRVRDHCHMTERYRGPASALQSEL